MQTAVVILIVLGVVVFVGMIGGLIFFIVAYQRKIHRERVARLSAWAMQRDWRYTESNPSLTTRFTGEPFRRGHGRRAQHMISGEHRGRRFAGFEYRYQVSSGTGDDHRTETYVFTMVAVRTPAVRPFLQVTQEGFGRKLLSLVGVQDLQLGYPPFDQTFHIKTGDERFARDVLQPGMMQWLLSDARALALPFRFEASDLICWGKGELTPERMMSALDYAMDLLDQTPSDVWHPDRNFPPSHPHG